MPYSVMAALSSLSGAAATLARGEAATPGFRGAEPMIAFRVADGGDLQLWR
ncbi:hypothetical protein QOM21_05080 [Streptomyces sp. Pv4-95]|uniref:hypothetical protein n=1 Tax=unclassified Streptomyces TaxID=2593676 RepID=UPI003710C2C4